jgi:hypothetical protein
MSDSVASPQKLEKKPVKFSNLLLGAGLNMFEVREYLMNDIIRASADIYNPGHHLGSALGGH